MTTVATERNETAAPERPGTYTALVVVVVTIGVFWPGGYVPLLDNLFMLGVLWILLRAVTRHPVFKQIWAAAPAAPRWIAGAIIGAFLLGQVWGVSAQTYPAVTWTMYSQDTGNTAAVYRFEATAANGEPVAFAPSAANPTLPAKMGLVHLRNLSVALYFAEDEDERAEAEARLARTIVAYVDLHNEQSSGPEPVTVEVSRVMYDITQDDLSYDAGVRTVLLQLDLEDS